MRKLFSIILTGILIIGTMFVLTGCSNNNSISNSSDNENSNNINQNDNTNITKTLKTQKAFKPLQGNSYYIKMLADVEDEQGNIVKNAVMEITVDNQNFATDIKDAGYGIIVKDNFMYYILHDAKQYTKMTLDPNVKQEMLANFSDDTYVDKFITSGEKELNGTKYYYEEFSFEKEKTTLYFKGDEIKYIESQYLDGSSPTLMQIVEISDKANSALFEIPATYNGMEINY